MKCPRCKIQTLKEDYLRLGKQPKNFDGLYCPNCGFKGSRRKLENANGSSAPIGSPIRVKLRRSKGWRLPANTVVVSRPTKWGNPFVVGKHGDRAECVRLFGLLMAGYLCISKDVPCVKDQERFIAHAKKHLPELRGKNLACWCRGKPCHADVLLELANVKLRDAAPPSASNAETGTTGSASGGKV